MKLSSFVFALFLGFAVSRDPSQHGHIGEFSQNRIWPQLKGESVWRLFDSSFSP
jgi:hypothetical protein